MYCIIPNWSLSTNMKAVLLLKKIFVVAPFLMCFTLVAQIKHTQISVEDYIDAYKGIAISEMKRTGIPASVTLAQGILESRFGNSYLAVKGRNHFGIKCHRSWRGMVIFARDDKARECFRKYKSTYASYIDHSNFLTRNQRYSKLFTIANGKHEQWAIGLKRAGYATDPSYARRLIKIINKYELYRFDQFIYGSSNCSEMVIATPMNYNGIKTVFFDCNVSLQQISRAYNISIDKLIQFNNCRNNDTIYAHTIIYLQMPKNKGPKGIKQHTVSENESMASIARLYGIKLNSLYKKNRMNNDTQPEVGDVLSVRKKVPKGGINQNETNNTNEGTQKITYKVKAEDTLYSLARRFGTTVDTIKKTNKLKSNLIKVGQQLKIYTN